MSVTSVERSVPAGVRLLRAVLTAVAAVLYALGWAAGTVWLPVAWAGTAVLVGFREATRS
jgi:hypothetical protein